MPEQHAILSPSSASRWMVCTPSARLEQQFEDQNSDYAAEGTLAHAVAELKVRKQFIEPMRPKAFEKSLNKLKKTKLYNNGELRKVDDYWPEIIRCTDEYLDYINKTALSYPSQPYVAAEQHLDLSKYIPEGFGTGDCIIIGGSTLHIIDYKHGKGVPVNADHNPQIMSYALGALERYRMFYNIKNVVMTIVQPRLNNISEFEMSVDELLDWGENTLKPKAEAAFAGVGEFVPGEHCRFCRAKAQCRARASTNTALEDFGYKKPPLLTDTEVGEILQKAIDLEKWASDLKDYALSAILDGKQIPGWKVVEGRSVRKFDDTDAAFETLKAAGVDEAMLYERKPLTLAAIEKMLGKAKFEEIAGKHIIAPPGKPTLVPESDKRSAYSTAKIDFRDIKEND